MPDGQYHDLLSVVVIQSDVGPMSEVNHPLAELRRQLFNGKANLWVPAHRFYALPDRLDSALGRISTLGGEKVVEAGAGCESESHPSKTKGGAPLAENGMKKTVE